MSAETWDLALAQTTKSDCEALSERAQTKSPFIPTGARATSRALHSRIGERMASLPGGPLIRTKLAFDRALKAVRLREIKPRSVMVP